MTYAAPLDDMRFVLNHLAGLPEIATLPGFEDAEPDLVEAILTEAGRFAGEVLAPLNSTGDRQGCRWSDGKVRRTASPRPINSLSKAAGTRCRPAPTSAARECQRWCRAR